MTKDQIIRAWKDEEFRLSLSETELGTLPEHPAGMIQVSEDEMQIAGGQGPTTNTILATMDFICYPTMQCDGITASYSCHK
jgi:mersacidin/lichenicidin family type 2 lantibiotic